MRGNVGIGPLNTKNSPLEKRDELYASIRAVVEPRGTVVGRSLLLGHRLGGVGRDGLLPALGFLARLAGFVVLRGPGGLGFKLRLDVG